MNKFRILNSILVLTLGITLLSATGYAQTGTIRGFVYLKKTGEPSLFTTVFLKGTTYGSVTDVNGYYSITHLPPGNYTIMITSMGYDTLSEDVTVGKGQIIARKLYLKESGINLKEVHISAQQQARQTETQVSTYVITPKDMEQIPTIGGQPEIAQYLQILPGVVSTGDQGGQIYIEGGQPVQNKVLLDGMTIFEPFHSIGLFSVFDGDIISDATVYAGGFNAEFGDRISSIMDIHTRDGNKKEVTGEVDASPFGAHALVEGPIAKNSDDDPNKASASFIISAKNSYLEQTSKTLFPWVDSGHGIPFNYSDYYGKVSINTANGSKINFFGFNYNDNVDYPNLYIGGWNQAGLGANFILVPASTTSLMEGNIDYSNYKIYQQGGDTSSIGTFSMGLKFTQFLGNIDLMYGFELSSTTTHYDFTNAENLYISEIYNSQEINGYVKMKFTSDNKKLILEPGFRMQYYGSLGEFSPEPRFDMKYNFTSKFRFKGAAGLYSQNLLAAINEQEVVDLFYAQLTCPPTSETPSTFTQQNGAQFTVNNPLQRAYHLTAGFEYDPSPYIQMDMQAYYKDFLQTTTLNYNQIYAEGTPGVPDTLSKPFLIQSGKAYGADMSIKYNYKRIMIYTVYSLGYVNYWSGTYSFPPPFDRRNNVNVVVSYKAGKDLSWMFDVRYNYGSGFPFTPTQGYYPMVPFNNITTNYTTSNGNLGIVYSGFDSQRLPDYSRLDVGVDKSYQISQSVGLHFNLSVINVMNTKNIFYINRIADQVVYQLPIMPSLSVGMTF